MWNKDAATLAPKIIYTPGEGDLPGMVRAIFDPNGEPGKKVIAEFDYIHKPDETEADLDAGWDIG